MQPAALQDVVQKPALAGTAIGAASPAAIAKMNISLRMSFTSFPIGS